MLCDQGATTVSVDPVKDDAKLLLLCHNSVKGVSISLSLFLFTVHYNQGYTVDTSLSVPLKPVGYRFENLCNK